MRRKRRSIMESKDHDLQCVICNGIGRHNDGDSYYSCGYCAGTGYMTWDEYHKFMIGRG
jgi:hypothetical protein